MSDPNVGTGASTLVPFVVSDFNATCIDLNISDNCMQLTGYMALYKVSFGISMFFTGLALISVGVTSSTGGELTSNCVNTITISYPVPELCLCCLRFFS